MPTSTYESDPNRERDNATTRSSVSAETTDGKPASIPSIETSISLNLDAFGRIDINSLLAPITPNPSHDPSTTPTAKSFHVMDINQTPSEEHVAPSTALTDKGNSIRAGSVLNSVKASKKSNDVTEYFQKGYEAYKVLLETYPDSMWHVVGYPRFKDDARNDDNTMGESSECIIYSVPRNHDSEEISDPPYLPELHI